MDATLAAAPGWYPDPWRHATWRWWDGTTWTGYTEHWFIPPAGATPAHRGQLPIRAGGIAALGVLAGFALAVGATILLLAAGVDESSGLLVLASAAGLWIGMGGACVVAVRRKGTGSLRDLGLTRVRAIDWLGIPLGVGGVVAVGIVAAVLTQISESLLPGERTDLQTPLDDGGAFGIVAVLFVAIVGAPFFEELFFRGLVQGTLVARFGSVVGIGAQALLFALVHLGFDTWLGSVGTIAIIGTVGVGLGLVRHVSGRLPMAMLAHGTYNAIIMVVTLLA